MKICDLLLKPDAFLCLRYPVNNKIHRTMIASIPLTIFTCNRDKGCLISMSRAWVKIREVPEIANDICNFISFLDILASLTLTGLLLLLRMIRKMKYIFILAKKKSSANWLIPLAVIIAVEGSSFCQLHSSTEKRNNKLILNHHFTMKQDLSFLSISLAFSSTSWVNPLVAKTSNSGTGLNGA